MSPSATTSSSSAWARAGITAAEFAARLGLRVAVVERARVGGDCLWTGCVPSKALIASARAADTIRHADRYGLRRPSRRSTWHGCGAASGRCRSGSPRTDDDPARYTALGIDVVFGTGRAHVAHHGARRRRPHASRPATSSSAPAAVRRSPTSRVWPTSATSRARTSSSSRNRRRSIVVIGGGPIGVELAQAFARLGIGTTLVHRGVHVLPREEPALVERARGAGCEPMASGCCTGAEPVSVTRVGEPDPGALRPSERTRRTRRGRSGAGRRRDGWPTPTASGWSELGIEVGEAGHRHRRDAAGPRCPRSTRPVTSPVVTGSPTPRPTTGCGPCATCSSRAEANVDEHGAVVHVHRPRTGPRRTHCRRGRATGTAATSRSGGATSSGERPRPGRRRDRRLARRRHRQGQARRRPHALAPTAGEMIHELALAIRRGMKLADLAGLIHVYPTYSHDDRPAGGRARLRPGPPLPVADPALKAIGTGRPSTPVTSPRHGSATPVSSEHADLRHRRHRAEGDGARRRRRDAHRSPSHRDPASGHPDRTRRAAPASWPRRSPTSTASRSGSPGSCATAGCSRPTTSSGVDGPGSEPDPELVAAWIGFRPRRCHRGGVRRADPARERRRSAGLRCRLGRRGRGRDHARHRGRAVPCSSTAASPPTSRWPTPRSARTRRSRSSSATSRSSGSGPRSGTGGSPGRSTVLDRVFFFDRLYLGGGNARHIDFELPDRVEHDRPERRAARRDQVVARRALFQVAEPVDPAQARGTARSTAPTTTTVTMPPLTTANGVPNAAAATPLSNAPSSFDAPMNTRFDGERPGPASRRG